MTPTPIIIGLGGFMLGHFADRARDLGSRLLWLQVKKKNTGTIAFCRSAGFEVVREAVFEIGEGIVMDDYVMAKGWERLRPFTSRGCRSSSPR